MKPGIPPDDDDSLSKLLGEWKLESTALPPRFQEQVWQRIQRSASSPGVGLRAVLFAWLAQAFARRSLAFGYVTVLLVAGLLGGYWQARLGNERADEKLSAHYVQMLDPYLTHP